MRPGQFVFITEDGPHYCLAEVLSCGEATSDSSVTWNRIKPISGDLLGGGTSSWAFIGDRFCWLSGETIVVNELKEALKELTKWKLSR